MSSVVHDNQESDEDLWEIGSRLQKSRFRLKNGHVDAICREAVNRALAEKNGEALRRNFLGIVNEIKAGTSKYDFLIPKKESSSSILV